MYNTWFLYDVLGLLRMEETSLMDVLCDEVEQLKYDYCYPDLGRAFQHWCAAHILSLVDEDVAMGIKGNQARDKGIDYLHVDEDEETVNILQTKFSDKLNTTVSNEDLSSFFATPDRLSNGYQGDNAFRERHAQYVAAVSRGFKINLIFVMTGDLTDTNKEEIEIHKLKLSENMTFDCIENKDLPGLVGDPPSPPCKLNVVENEVFVSMSSDMQSRKVVATVQGSELARIYSKIGPNTLFSANPRKYIPSKGASRDIKKTLESEPERLWHYNNGVSAVCESFEYDKQDRSLKIKNFKIVNGCQTVSTIAKQKFVSEHATVLLRLSQVSDQDFRRAISANTNNQQPVKASDLYSNRDELKILEHKFKKYPAFFWERKKGDLRGLDDKTRSRYTKEKRQKLYVIDNVVAARLKLAFGLGKPHLSITIAEKKIFSNDEIGQSGLRAFTTIYGNAKPSEFILPNIFLYLIKNLDVGNHRESEALISITLGRYYVIGMIDRILQSIQSEERSRLEEQIIKAASDYDEETIEELRDNLRKLVEWMSLALPRILEQPTIPLHEHAPTGLRDKLKEKDVLDKLHVERQCQLSLAPDSTDWFKEKLSQTFGARC